jgi:hypothetical protein
MIGTNELILALVVGLLLFGLRPLKKLIMEAKEVKAELEKPLAETKRQE